MGAGTTLTEPNCQCASPRPEQRLQIGEVWLIITAINLIASKLIKVT